jgi:hypothetical protein
VTDTERPMGARYRLDEADGSWWEVGWDRPLATFYAQHYSPVPFDPFSGDDLLHWYGTDLAELPTTEALAARLPLALPDDVARELAADAAAYPNLGPPPFLAAARDLLDALAAAPGRHPTASMAAVFVDDSNRGEATGPAPGSQWSLPAAPVAQALRTVHADPALREDDIETFAAGLGLRSDLVRGVLEGKVDELGVDEVVAVCEGLRCTPAQLWGRDLAGQIAHAYDPAAWPEHTEPLAGVDGGAATHDEPADRATFTVLATCYVETGVVAIDAAGRTVAVSDLQGSCDPEVDYHCRYRQVAEPVPVAVAIAEERFARGPVGGVDAEPALAEVAQRLRQDAWPNAVDMVRFTAPDGGEQWLGWDGATQSLQAWDDPRRYFGGEARVVLDPAGFADPLGTPERQLRLDEEHPDAVSQPVDHEVDGVDLACTGPFDL